MKNIKIIVIMSTLLFLISCGHKYPLLNKDFELPSDYTYIIGPGDQLDIFVWDNPDISRSIVVRPDGKISAPLINDLSAIDKTPSELATELEFKLGKYIVKPVVTVVVNNFEGIYQQQIRVVGQINQGSSSRGSSRSSGSISSGSSQSGSSRRSGNTSNKYSAQTFPYRKSMTLLDLMVQVGGIGEFADGNRSSIIRKTGGKQKQFGVRIDDLLEDGDLTANVNMQPGDILVIPESFF